MMDYISSLPDDILRRILCFLTTKEAAVTSVLAKRWRNLFKSVPEIDLDDSIFLRPEEGKGERDEIQRSFLYFVSRVVASRGDSPIEKFSLKYSASIDKDYVGYWIHNVLERGARDINLLIDDVECVYGFPSEILMSKKLVKLKIVFGSYFDFDKGTELSLPMLKTLVLDSFWFYNGQLQKLLSACPALEELVLSNIKGLSNDETVSSATLKTLTVKTVKYLYAFSLDTPKVVSLKYSEHVADDYPVLNLESLVEAQIELLLTGHQLGELRARNDDSLNDDVFLQLGQVQKLFRGVRSVKKLYLSPGALQLLALCCQTMPVFKNLVCLDIDCTLKVAWQAMPVLLRNSPHLETLVITGLAHNVTNKCGDACNCIAREEKGRSLISCPVKRLEIREFNSLGNDLSMIKHFLNYFPCLKEVDVYFEDCPQQFAHPLVPERLLEILTLYNDVCGRSRNVQFKVYSYLLYTAEQN